MSKRYIHYGSDIYDPNKVRIYHGVGFGNKPPCGLWASPIDADYGCKEWRESSGYDVDRLSKSFEFDLSEFSNILTVNKYEDIEKYVVLHTRIPIPLYRINYRSIMNEYDGLELRDLSLAYDMGANDKPTVFYGWDYQSIVVWNPDVIKPVVKSDQL